MILLVYLQETKVSTYNLDMEGKKYNLRKKEVTKNSQEAEIFNRAKKVLAWLGINDKEIESWVGKRVLDVGALEGDVVNFLQSRGVDATALDIDDSFSSSVDNFVVGDAYDLPFANESFDSVLAHANPAFDMDTKQDGVPAFLEAFRVSKKGGEIRVGPFFSPEDKNEKDYTDVYLNKLKNIFKDVEVFEVNDPGVQGYKRKYFLIKKY